MSSGAHKDADTMLNGSSLHHLTGTVTKSRTITETRFPASRMAEVLDQIHRLGNTGQLQVNFHNGRALDMAFVSTRNAKQDDT